MSFGDLYLSFFSSFAFLLKRCWCRTSQLSCLCFPFTLLSWGQCPQTQKCAEQKCHWRLLHQQLSSITVCSQRDITVVRGIQTLVFLESVLKHKFSHQEAHKEKSHEKPSYLISTRFLCSSGMIQYEWNHSLFSAVLEGSGSQAHSLWCWCRNTEQAWLSPISCAMGKAWDSAGSCFLCIRECPVPCVKHRIKGGRWQCQLVCLCWSQ